MNMLLAAVRLAHFAVVALLFGLAAFGSYARTPGEGGQPPEPWLRNLAAAAVLTTGLVLLVTAMSMTGQIDVIFHKTLFQVLGGTVFGQVWSLRLLFSLVVLALAFRPRPWEGGTMAIASALLLITIGLTGHSRLPGGALGWAHMFADMIHLLAAGAWIGGLGALIHVLGLRRIARDGAAAKVLHQFSGMGYFAVAALVLTGLFKSWLLLGTAQGLVGTPYGWVLMAKILLFAGMAALALVSRARITPALEAGAEPALWLPRLKQQATLELALGLAVLVAVAWLGALQPPVVTA